MNQPCSSDGGCVVPAVRTASPVHTMQHQEIIEYYRLEILTGRLASGSRSPVEREIQDEWAVSSLVARRVVNTLKALALVEARHFQGARVSDTHRLQTSPADLLWSELPEITHRVEYAQYSAGLSAPAAIGPLGLSEAAQIVTRRTTIFVCGTPQCVETSWYSLLVVNQAGLTKQLLSLSPLGKRASILIAHGLGGEVSRTIERVEASPITDGAVAQLLSCTPDYHTLKVSQTCFNEIDWPLEYSEYIYLPGSEIAYTSIAR